MNLKSLFPFTLRRIFKKKAGVPDTWNSLIQLKDKHSFNPKVIFDIGAYKGDWTKMCLKIYPKSKFYLFEPQDCLSKFLNSFQNKNIVKRWIASPKSSLCFIYLAKEFRPVCQTSVQDGSKNFAENTQ